MDEGEAAERELVRASAAVSALVSSLIAAGLERATPGYAQLAELVREIEPRCGSRTTAEGALATMRATAAKGASVLQAALDALRAIELAATPPTTKALAPKPARPRTRTRTKKASAR